MRRCLALLMTALALIAPARAQVGVQVSVRDAWVRAVLPVQGATAAYFTLSATGDARLLEVTTPLAGIAEIHEMRREGEIMRMRALDDGVALPAGQRVEFKPGGLHVMLMDLKQHVASGARVPLTLLVVDAAGKRQRVTVEATVRALVDAGTPAPGRGGH